MKHWSFTSAQHNLFNQNQFVLFEALLDKVDPKTIGFRKDLATLVADLLVVPTLRFGFAEIINRPLSGLLKQNFALQGLLGGFAIDLSQNTPYDLIVLNADLPTDKLALSHFLLVGYTDPRPVYIYYPQDPQNKFLQEKGYSYGDKMKESTHPTLFRR